jgi:predicted AAA+ superfamily ATPase
MREEPVVILTGPRTVGKSTLLAALAAEFDRPVLDLDRPDARAAAASDPGFIVSGPGPVLIDEFQHVPEILDAIKAELNTDTRPGRYVLTGSTRYSVLPGHLRHPPHGTGHKADTDCQAVKPSPAGTTSALG